MDFKSFKTPYVVFRYIVENKDFLKFMFQVKYVHTKYL